MMNSKFISLFLVLSLLFMTIPLSLSNVSASSPQTYTEHMVERFNTPVTGWTYYNAPSVKINTTHGYYSDDSLQVSFSSGSVGYARYITFPLTYPFEISYYFNLTTINAGNGVELLGFNNGANRTGLNLWAVLDGSGTVNIAHYNGTTITLSESSLNEWHYIYVVAANANSWKITIDGVYISTVTVPRATQPITGLIVGKTNTAGAIGTLYIDDITITNGRGDYPGVDRAIIDNARSLPSITMPILTNNGIYIPYMVSHQLDSWLKGYQWSTWTASYKIGDNPGYDYHACPTVIRDNDGYFHAFYGSHNSPILYSVSNSPDDITAWTSRDALDIEGTYPFPFHSPSGDGIYIIYRDAVWNWNITYSDDNGINWNSPFTIIEHSSSPAALIYISTPEIYEHNLKTYIATSWVTDYGHGPEVVGEPFMRENLYYGLYCVDDMQWYSYRGEPISPTVTYQNEYEFKIWDSDDLRSETPMLKMINNHPYITWQRLTDEGEYVLSFIYLNGLKWSAIEDIATFETRPFIENGFTYTDGELSVVFSNPDTLEVIKYVRASGKWSVDSVLLNRTTLNYDCRYSTVKNVGGTDDMIVIYEAKHNSSDIYTDVRIWVYSSEHGFITDGTDISVYDNPGIEPFVDFAVLTNLLVFVLPIIILGWYGGKYGVVIGIIIMSFVTMTVFEHGVVIMICGCIGGVVILLNEGEEY